MAVRKFQRGSAVYTCTCCGKQTRNTGDEGQSKLCLTCYDLSGIENELSDNGSLYASSLDTVQGAFEKRPELAEHFPELAAYVAKVEAESPEAAPLPSDACCGGQGCGSCTAAAEAQGEPLGLAAHMEAVLAKTLDACLELFLEHGMGQTSDQIARVAEQLPHEVAGAIWDGVRRGLIVSVPGTRQALWLPSDVFLRRELLAWRSGERVRTAV